MKEIDRLRKEAMRLVKKKNKSPILDYIGLMAQSEEDLRWIIKDLKRPQAKRRKVTRIDEASGCLNVGIDSKSHIVKVRRRKRPGRKRD